MHSRHQFYCKLILVSEKDSNLHELRFQFGLGCPCWLPKMVANKEDIQELSYYVFHLFGGKHQLRSRS
jgi:hypothetical protein